MNRIAEIINIALQETRDQQLKLNSNYNFHTMLVFTVIYLHMWQRSVIFLLNKKQRLTSHHVVSFPFTRCAAATAATQIRRHTFPVPKPIKIP